MAQTFMEKQELKKKEESRMTHFWQPQFARK